MKTNGDGRMLQLVIPPVEGWDESKEEFVELEKEQKQIGRAHV